LTATKVLEEPTRASPKSRKATKGKATSSATATSSHWRRRCPFGIFFGDFLPAMTPAANSAWRELLVDRGSGGSGFLDADLSADASMGGANAWRSGTGSAARRFTGLMGAGPLMAASSGPDLLNGTGLAVNAPQFELESSQAGRS
jgi:hypothetical protein